MTHFWFLKQLRATLHPSVCLGLVALLLIDMVPCWLMHLLVKLSLLWLWKVGAFNVVHRFKEIGSDCRLHRNFLIPVQMLISLLISKRLVLLQHLWTYL